MLMFPTRAAAALALAVFAITAPAAAQDMAFELTNDTDYVIVEFYASPTVADDWEEDILGDMVIESGETIEVIIADGREYCEYDIMMVLDTGEELVDEVDICELASYTLSQM